MFDLEIENFNGIPNAMDYLPYEIVYYNAVKERTVAEFGKHATLLNATRAMNMLGNVCYFKKFPDIYNSSKEDLGFLYQTEFPILGNEFNDFEHGLSHIRSLAAHTSMGESLLKPDQLYFTGMRYGFMMKTGNNIDLNNCPLNLRRISPLSKFNMPRHSFLKIELHRLGIRHRPNFDSYKNIYHSDKHQFDYPEAIHLTKKHFTEPANNFEKRLGLQLVRAIYMDEKFKKFSASQNYFFLTPIKDTIHESYELAFTNEKENLWIHKINDIVVNPSPKEQLQTIVNTTGNQSSDAQILAAETIKVLSNHFL